jgi:xanthine dehydrogenase iron-sulfur cluster and FAD-binding subunit A
MWNNYICVNSLEDAVRILAKRGEAARIVAGATDLILELERGVRKGIDTLVDITRISGLDRITLDEAGWIHLGPLVTHNRCVASKLIFEQAFPLARATMEVGAPQIRNRGTVAGNLITASPANDTIPPLMAMQAQVTLRSAQGDRIIPLEDFYTGVRKTVMRPEEILVDIAFPALDTNQRGTFYKLGLRRAQAISVVNTAIVITLDGEKIIKAAITLGSVAPTIVHAAQAEDYLEGRTLTEETISVAAEMAKSAARPIDDVRSSREYRLEMVRVCVLRALRALFKGEERQAFPARPVLLQTENGKWKHKPTDENHNSQEGDQPIVTRINGKTYIINNSSRKTLLRLLREDAGLIGTKEGCAEGECGACTVFLDGMAVMSCLVPAPRAHGAEIMTIEGLAKDGILHPVQQAFIDQGAVQCGYCTPGFVMSAAMLLEEMPGPSRDEIKQAISGNLCRCTGYYSIVAAIEQAAHQLSQEGV